MAVTETWHSLPLFVRLQGRAVILLGEGEAADAKRRLLERAGAVIVGEDVQAALAIVALDDPEAAVLRLRARGVLVNAVDRPELCDFTVPAIVDRDPVLVAIGTGGASAGLAAALRQRLEALVPGGLGRLAMALFAGRGAMRERWPEGAARRRALSEALAAGGVLDVLREPPSDDAYPGEGRGPATEGSQLGPGLRRGGEAVRVARWLQNDGIVAAGAIYKIRLASADPDDLTLRDARALANADRVTHRAGVPAAVLDRARADAAREECADVPGEGGPGLTVDVTMG